MAVNNAIGDKTERWYFTKEQLENTPSRKAGYDAFKELSYRQQAANFIQDMGQRLKVSKRHATPYFVGMTSASGINLNFPLHHFTHVLSRKGHYLSGNLPHDSFYFHF